MPLFKVSVGSEVPVSAVVVSNAPTLAEALTEVRLLQSRARVNWRRGSQPIGAIEAPYEIWGHPGTAGSGSFVVSLYALIPISARISMIAEDAETVEQVVRERQRNGLIEWLYRGIPVGDYTDPIPTFWSNRQPNIVTVTTSAISSNQIYPGQSVSMTADVSGEETPVGNLEFRDSVTGTVIVPTTLEPDAATEGLAHASAVVVLPSGSFSIQAAYLGSDGYQGSSSAPQVIAVSKIPSAVLIVTPDPPIYAGQSVSLNITVTHLVAGAPKPTGVITLFSGTDVIGSKQLDTTGPSSTGSFSLGVLDPGIYSFTVQYSGDAIHEPSLSSASTVTVLQVPTTTVLSILSPGTVAVGFVFSQVVRLQAIVTSGVDGTIPTGTITFKEGTNVLGVGALGIAPGDIDANSDGIIDPSTNAALAFIDVSTFSVGSHPSLTASYSGNFSFAASVSGSSSVTVAKASTVVNAASLNSPTVRGATANLDATVSVVFPATMTPFQKYGTGGSVVHSTGVTVNFDGTGHATRSRSDLVVGTNQLSAAFNATAEFNASSTAFTHTVTKSQTLIGITFFSPSTTSYAYNTLIEVGLSVVAPGTGNPTGTVSFSVFDHNYYGNLFLGMSAVSYPMGSPIASLSFSWFTLISDNYTYTAQYNGDSNFNSSVTTQVHFGFGYFF